MTSFGSFRFQCARSRKNKLLITGLFSVPEQTSFYKGHFFKNNQTLQEFTSINQFYIKQPFPSVDNWTCDESGSHHSVTVGEPTGHVSPTLWRLRLVTELNSSSNETTKNKEIKETDDGVGTKRSSGENQPLTVEIQQLWAACSRQQLAVWYLIRTQSQQ